MSDIPVLASDHALSTHIDAILRTRTHNAHAVVALPDMRQAIEYLHLEMPALIFLNVSDPQIDGRTILDTIMQDQWLLHGGIIALVRTYQEAQALEEVRGANIIVMLTYDELTSHLATVMDIIDNNKGILFQRGIGADLVHNIAGSYQLANDLIEVRCYANLICNFLHNLNKLDTPRKAQLRLALVEMLVNAIEHGNCRISSEEKAAWMAGGKTMHELIRQKVHDPDIAAKKVHFEYTLTPRSARFRIADEGNGFHWRTSSEVAQPDNPLALQGRGILMTKQVTRNFRYNDRGNAVTFDMEYPSEVPSTTPALFRHMTTRDVKKDDIIFQQGDPSACLYYIVKGDYRVLVNDKPVSTLTSADIFIGEMSFLLHNRRSATIRAASDGTLIEVSKKDFVEAIKQTPHYALFMSRLLAQRIQRLNLFSSKYL